MKNLILFISAMLSFSLSIQAQLVSSNELNSFANIDHINSDHVETEKRMERSNFIILQKEVIRKIQNDIIYPEVAYENGVEGQVMISFVFDGEMSKLEVLKSLSSACDAAALNAVKNFTKYYKEFGGQNISPLKVIIPFTFGITL